MANNKIDDILKSAFNSLERGLLKEAEISIQELEYITDIDSVNLANVFLIKAELASRRGDYDLALSLAEKALTIGKENQDEKIQAKALKIIGVVYYFLGSYHKSLEHFNKVLALHQKEENKSGIAQILGNMGGVFMNQGLLEEGLEYYSKALEIHTELDDKLHIAIMTGNIGNVYCSYGMLDIALEYYTKALFMHEQMGDKQSFARVTGNLGQVYRLLKEYEKAIECFSKSLDLQTELGVKEGIAIFSGNIGLAYTENGLYEKALEFQLNALKLNQELGIKQGIASSTGNIGNVYYKLCIYDKALDYMSQAVTLHEELGNFVSANEVRGNLGTLYGDKNNTMFDFELSEKYLLQSISQSENNGRKNHLLSIYETLSTLYENENHFEKFALYYRKYHNIYVTVQNEEVKKQADRFGWERKIADMEKQKEIEAVKTEANKVLLEETISFQKQSLEQQAREVKNTVDELVRKNSLLQLIQSDLKKIAPHTKREGTDYIDQLLERVTRNITPLESNQQLDKQLTEVHGEFILNLHQKFPDLTTMELKIAALLSMKLTSSNIAAALFLAKRTVESHRFSLRKKMGLGTSDDIYQALAKYMVL